MSVGELGSNSTFFRACQREPHLDLRKVKSMCVCIQVSCLPYNHASKCIYAYKY